MYTTIDGQAHVEGVKAQRNKYHLCIESTFNMAPSTKKKKQSPEAAMRARYQAKYGTPKFGAHVLKRP
jgi:hypothetical protein